MIRLVLVLFVALIVANPAWACDCIALKGPFLRAVERGVVATGRVVAVQFDERTGVLVADVDVMEAFANATKGSRMKVYANEFSSCGYRLREGEEYLLLTEYVTRDSAWRGIAPGSQAVGLCGGTKALNTPEGQEMLAAIREELRQQRK